MIRRILRFVVHVDGEFLSRHVATDRGVRHMSRVLDRMRRIQYKQPASLARKRAVSIVFANDRTILSTWCFGYIARSW